MRDGAHLWGDSRRANLLAPPLVAPTLPSANPVRMSNIPSLEYDDTHETNERANCDTSEINQAHHGTEPALAPLASDMDPIRPMGDLHRLFPTCSNPTVIPSTTSRMSLKACWISPMERIDRML